MINHPNRKKPAAKKKVSAASVAHNHDHDYSALLTSIRASFDAAVGAGKTLFATNVEGLNDLYLDNLPSERQVHTCHCCRRFIATYGGLVTIDANGATHPVMWNPDGVPDFYRPAFAAMFERVRKARVESVFLSKEPLWGTPHTGDWSHMSVVPPYAMIYRERALTASQSMAAAKENFRTVAAALSEFTAPTLDEALRLFTAETLARSEKFVGPVKWLRTLYDRPKGRAGENVLWQAVATAPEGYCHPKASVIGPLLNDIDEGLPFATIKQRFDAMLGPLRYQRPQAAPSVGNIKAAEALVEKLGIARSLERRFARFDEVPYFWLPRPEVLQRTVGVFGHLKPKDDDAIRPVNIPAVTMTWDKFLRTVLAGAAVEQMELLVPHTGRFIALTTAEHADAPPILKWDNEDERNPVAWYVYPSGSTARQWGLAGGSWCKVLGVTKFPTQWGSRPMSFLAEGVVLILDGAMDSMTTQGSALFPENLKEELHGARSTIEAYSRSAQIGGRDGVLASGYDVRKGNGSADCAIRVRVDGAWTSYHIDRWD